MMNFFRRLYRNETNFDFIGSRKRWYLSSLIILIICVGSMAIKGFNWGIEFSGGSSFLLPKPAGTSLEQAREAVESVNVDVQTAQQVGSGGNQRYSIKTEELNTGQINQIKDALSERLGVNKAEINDSAVSSSWGSEITQKGLIALVVFLALVSLYIWIRFEQKMAIAAILALIHDLVVTAGIYSIVGFEVTPSTVIGLLTILGFSLYDTVVVFDRVAENTRGLLNGTRFTYGEAANQAVNQTLMRSINTSLISLFPVAGLLFVGAGLLGVGTLKDLALVLFVGLAAGAYSSLFLATPWLVDLKEHEPKWAAHKQRILARRAKERDQIATLSDEIDEDNVSPDDTSELSPTTVGRSAAARRVTHPPRRRGRPGKPGRPSGAKKRR